MKYVIIGNSAAGIGCAEGIRRVDTAGKILILSDEKYHTYSRPLISYLLEGKTDLQRMKYRPDDFYEKNHITFRPETAVTAIDATKKTITAGKGEQISYDKLLYAAGSSPFIPPTEGYDSVKESFTFMKLDDALALKEALTPESRVLIVGAGLIGLKCAEGIHGLCKEITVADLADRVLSSILDADTAPVIQKKLEENGIRFLLSDCVTRYEGNIAHMKSGETVPFDVLVTCVGVRPNVQLLKDAGAAVGRGIHIDTASKTSLPDVYAAGDCTECVDISSGDTKILALLPNAYKQGEIAGMNMAGAEKTFADSIPMNAIGFFGLHMITAGTYTGEVIDKSQGENVKKLYCKDNLLKGYIMIGDVDKAGIYTSLIRDRVALDSIDFALVSETPGLMAFSKKYRDETLGGLRRGY